jgi:hypothetical protein
MKLAIVTKKFENGRRLGGSRLGARGRKRRAGEEDGLFAEVSPRLRAHYPKDGEAP